MKVMVLGVRGIPDVQGGVETHAAHLYERMAKLGCDVEVIVRSPFVPAGRRFSGAVKLTRLWAPKRTGVEALVHSILGVLYAIVRRADVLHVHAIGPAIVTPLARLGGLRVVVTHHGADYERDKWGGLARFILRTGESWGMRFSNARIVVAPTIAANVKRLYGVDSEAIPNGVVPSAPIAPGETLKRFGLEPRRYVLQVSRLVPEKRQLDLIEAFARARPAGFKLVLVGKLDDSDYTARVREAAARTGTILTDFMTGAPLAEIYSNAGLFVLPSSHEGLPIAILEALSHGLPVIGSDIPANRDVGLDDECYYPLGDLDRLASKIGAAAGGAEDETARESRRAFVRERYDWDAIAARTMDVYRRIAGDAGK